MEGVRGIAAGDHGPVPPAVPVGQLVSEGVVAKRSVEQRHDDQQDPRGQVDGDGKAGAAEGSRGSVHAPVNAPVAIAPERRPSGGRGASRARGIGHSLDALRARFHERPV